MKRALRTPSLKFFITTLFLFTANFSLSAQDNARLVGKVTDKATGEELIGASVVVVGTSLGAKTNIDGEFSLNVKVGKVDLRVSYVGYQTRTVKGIEVKAGQVNRADIELKAEAAQAEEIVVQAEISNATESALLTQQRKSLVVQDAISAETIKKTPDSDAGETVKRVTGVSLVGGKYVFVRGLGERYSNARLNGVTIPSPEPEKKIVPFDLIPANMIENIITIKTFMPDQPGSFGGGLVDIKTKEFPDQFVLSFTAGTGFNTQTHFKNNIPNYPGGKLDFLGIDDGTRNLPSGLPNLRLGSATLNDEVTVARLLGNNFQPTTGAYFPNTSFSLAAADQIRFGSIPIGYIASLGYGSDAVFKRTKFFFPSLETIQQGGEALYNYPDAKIATYNVSWGALLNFTTRLNDNNKLSLKTTYNRTMEDETFEAIGIKNLANSGRVKTTRLRFIERQLLSSQLSGNHYLNWLAKSELNWIAAYSTAMRNEPDNRETAFIEEVEVVPGGEGYGFSFDNSAGRNLRFFAELDDRVIEGKADLTVPFNFFNGMKSKAKFGGLYNVKNREFAARRFVYQTGSDFQRIRDRFPNTVLSEAFVREGLTRIQDQTNNQDTYTADENVAAGYAMAELPLTQKLRLVGGLRLEKNQFSIESRNQTGERLLQKFDALNLLPSANFILSPNEEINFRLSFSQTIANPELRELAPFRFDDYRTSTIGNPFLVQTTLQNYDFRVEWFPRLGELIAFSFFYKTLENPIERVTLAPTVTNQGNVLQNTAINAKSAKNFGVELEARKRLDVIASLLKDFSVGVNVTLNRSEAILPDIIPLYDVQTGGQFLLQRQTFTSTERPLQGQSPYIVNFKLDYNNPDAGFSAILLYNIVGRRIYGVGGGGLPDTYEEPRNQLDFSMTKTLFVPNFSAKLSIRNILNDRFLFTAGEFETERFKIGQIYSLALSYSL
ncbi:MAG: TonB-dependent receptor domain-containing protein [Chloroherpetonaceae bacterium]